MSDPRNGSLACQQTVLACFSGTLSQEAVATLPPCTCSLSKLLRLVFPLTACGSVHGTMGSPAQQFFVMCLLCGQSLLAIKPNTPATPLQNCYKNPAIKAKCRIKIQWVYSRKALKCCMKLFNERNVMVLVFFFVILYMC